VGAIELLLIEGRGLGCMRNALSTAVIVSVMLCPILANGAQSAPISLYAASLSDPNAGLLDTQPRLLPLEGTSATLSSTGERDLRSDVQTSPVEAIPTPTAFQAGWVLLLVIFVSRFIRKPRWI
jgi:hypothetical protein